MEDNYKKEFGIVSIHQETKFNKKFFIVDVEHHGMPTNGVPHLPFRLTTTSLDKLRSFLIALGVNGYCSNYAEPVGPTSIRPCTEKSEVPVRPSAINDFIDQIMQWLNENDNPLDLTVGNISEEELKNRLKEAHWLLQEGALADDESLATLLQNIYKARKRPEVDKSDNP